VLGEIHSHCRFSRYNPSLLVAQRCRFSLLLGMKRGHCFPGQK
jgi:hypothetical protein